MYAFIRSRGHASHEDYRWVELLPESEHVVEARHPSPYEVLMRPAWMHTEGIVYALARFDSHLMLLLQDLPSLTRRDFMGRIIHDTVLWVGDAQDEAGLRGILSHVLTEPGWLPTLFEISIKFDSSIRFRINRTIFEAAVGEAERGATGEDLPRMESTVCPMDDVTCLHLAEEIQSTCLPQGDGILVIIDSGPSRQAIVSAEVWRGLYGDTSDEETHSFLQHGGNLRQNHVIGTLQNTREEVERLLRRLFSGPTFLV